MRTARLFDLLQLLRRHRRPVTARTLAEACGVSVRTLYRDIATLQALGAPIDGSAGIGYRLRPGFVLPPLMFTRDECDALALGLAMVARDGDAALADAARDALARIAAVLPGDAADALETPALLAGPRADAADGAVLAALRDAIRRERRLAVRYVDRRGADSQRVIWPLAIGFFDGVRVVVAWCELRGDFRHFRTDRLAAPTVLPDRYPRPRRALLLEWRAAQGISAD